MKFSKLGQSISNSTTMASTLKAQELKSQGQDIVIGTVGEPLEGVSEDVKAALTTFLKSEPSRYGPAQGLLRTRKVLSHWLEELYDTSYNPDQIVISPGSKFGLYALMQILCQSGDEVIIPAPYWVSYLSHAKMANATPVVCQPNDEYKLAPKILEQALTSKSRLLILNSPNNPSGSVYSLKELRDIYSVLKDHPQVDIICDDIYNQIINDDSKRAPSLIDIADDEFKKRIILVHGASKSYAMTGWRMGWIAADKICIEKLTAFFSQTLTCVPDFIQIATEQALTNGAVTLSQFKEKIKQRHAMVQKELSALSGITVYPSEGAFYAWISLTDKSVSSMQIAQDLLGAEGLALVAGESFGMPGHLRLSVTLNDADLKKAVSKLKSFFSKKG